MSEKQYAIFNKGALVEIGVNRDYISKMVDDMLTYIPPVPTTNNPPAPPRREDLEWFELERMGF